MSLKGDYAMKQISILSITFIAILTASSFLQAMEFKIADFERENNLGIVISVTKPYLRFRVIGREEKEEYVFMGNGSLEFKAKLTEDSETVKQGQWHGFIIQLDDEMPAGILKFRYFPKDKGELWISIMGKDESGKPITIDFPINMYGANVVKLNKWNEIKLNLKKGHIVQEPPGTWGALRSFSRVEIMLHPHQYREPGEYEWFFDNFTTELVD